mgnify:CR=1 FL=1
MTMDSIEKLNTAITVIDEARGVPLSASCVVHRGEMLEILEGAREMLPKDLFAAEVILAEKEQIIEEGRASAEAMIATAREDVARMVEQTAIGVEAEQQRADAAARTFGIGVAADHEFLPRRAFRFDPRRATARTAGFVAAFGHDPFE